MICNNNPSLRLRDRHADHTSPNWLHDYSLLVGKRMWLVGQALALNGLLHYAHNCEEVFKMTLKSRLKWFGHVMQMREERLPKKMLQIKMEGKWPRGRSKTRWIDQIRKNIKMRGENWKKIQENRSGGIETAGDFSVIVDLYLWKWWWRPQCLMKALVFYLFSSASMLCRHVAAFTFPGFAFTLGILC